MKGNKGVYILLPVVAIVWGLIAYRVVKYVGPGNTEIASPPVAEVKFEPERFEKDTFSIQANYKDPFLYSDIQQKNPSTENYEKPIAKVGVIEKKRIKDPDIIFSGMIKNKKTGKTIAVLKINGKIQNLTPGESTEGVKLLTINKDAIQIWYAGKKRTIFKK